MLRSLAVGAFVLASVLGGNDSYAQYPGAAPATPFAVGAAAPTAPALAPAAATAGPAIRLHALDCGRIHLSDMGMFSDTGEYDGRPGMVVTPCFLIVHPAGTLLWDTGLGDHLAGKGAIAADPNTVLQVDVSLASQLERIGIPTINYLALSHLHFDHTGNANAYRNATWLIDAQEMQSALAEPDAFIKPDDFRPARHNKQVLTHGDHDVFGDGSVKLLKAPGHTPGHRVLLVRLPNSGPIILSGDLYHTRENRHYQRVPTFNASRADTLASMNRIETLARNLNARVVIQHDPEDFATLPHVPLYLE